MPGMRLGPLAAVIALTSVLSVSSYAQTLVERVFVLRAETTTMDPYSGMTHICVLVYPNAQYRLERSFQGLQGSGQHTRVFLGEILDSHMKQLSSILEEPNFVGLQTGEPRGGIVQDMDMLTITVPREHALQSLTFVNAAARKPFEKTLKPFQQWMKDLEKRKVQESKSEPANNCKAPQVVYRSIGTQPPASLIP